MQPIVYYLKNPSQFFLGVIKKCRPFLSDRKYLRAYYYFKIGKKLNLDVPVSFNEKLQWLKLYDRNPEYTKMVDKIEAKKYVSSMLGEQYIIPTTQIWDKVSDIDISKLPERFILKTSHGGGGGGVVICHDRSKFNWSKERNKLENSMHHSIYDSLAEWPYKDVKRRIFAEQYIETKGELNDYKFFCFNGKVEYFKIDFGRFIEHHANYFDRDCNLLPFGEADFPPVFDLHIEIPDNINEMIAISEKLAEGRKFLRVDLYNVGGRILFGEMTFFPASGFGKFTPEEWDDKLGALLRI